MKIYTGTMKDVTEDLLLTWLLRDVFHAYAPRQPRQHTAHHGQIMITALDAPPTPIPLDGEEHLLTGLAGDPALAVVRLPYLTRAAFFTGDKLRGALELAQRTASTVEVTFWEEDAGLFAEELRAWLIRRYGCEVTHLKLTPKQQEQWNELQEFTTLVQQSGRELQDVEQAEIKVEPGTMRKKWNRLRTKIGVDPPWPR